MATEDGSESQGEFEDGSALDADTIKPPPPSARRADDALDDDPGPVSKVTESFKHLGSQFPPPNPDDSAQPRHSPKRSDDVVQPPPPFKGADTQDGNAVTGHSIVVSKSELEIISEFRARKDHQTKLEMEVAARRRLIGYVLGAVTIVTAGGFILWSLSALDSLKGPLRPEHEKFAIAKLAAHAVISVAFMIFVYSMMRISERMVLPDWWKPALRKTMLGYQDPVTNVTRVASKAIDVGNNLLERLTDLVEKMLPGQTQKKKERK